MFVALSLSTAAFAQATTGNGAGVAGGAAGNTPRVGGQSGAATGQTGGTPTDMQEGRSAAENPAGGGGLSGQQRMGNGSNGTNAANGLNGNTTGQGDSKTTNPQNSDQ